jgi:hypothetical protein
LSQPPALPAADAQAGVRRRLFGLALGAALALGIGWLIGARPPAWAPPCPFHYLTGLHCPGCASTRATLALLHGDLARALRMNGLLVLSLPLLLAWAGLALWRGFRYGRPPAELPRHTATVALVVLLLFAVLRNLPWWPFVLLAPHS